MRQASSTSLHPFLLAHVPSPSLPPWLPPATGPLKAPGVTFIAPPTPTGPAKGLLTCPEQGSVGLSAHSLLT